MKIHSFLILLSSALISVRANDEDRINECMQTPIGQNRLPVDLRMRSGQALCHGNVQFGIFASKGEVRDGMEHTDYKVELRRGGKLIHTFRSLSIPSRDNAPIIVLQHDGNLLFGYSNRQPISGCVNFAGQDNSRHVLELTANDARLTITDGKGDVLWTFPQDGYRSCYPYLEPICHNALQKGQRMIWDEYICTHDNNGEIEYQFGMDFTGSLGLYHYGQLVYRPKSPQGWIRAHYLHLQNDGHLTAYERLFSHMRANVKWATGCVNVSTEKLVLTSDGDVLQLDKNGKTIWSLMGSQAPTGKVVDARDTAPTFCYA